MSTEGFKYVEKGKTKRQLKKDAMAKARAEAEEKMRTEIAAAKAQQKLDEQKKAAARLAAKASYRPELPINDSDYVAGLIRDVDFSAAEYVETISNGTLRRALVHHVDPDTRNEDDERYIGDVDCWIGGNVHFVDGMWIAGHSYLLGFRDFQMDTSPAAVTVIAALPPQLGTKPDIL